MYNHLERVLGFGKNETRKVEQLSPAEALHKLYDTDDEVAVVIERFVSKRAEILAYDDKPTVDRDVLGKIEADVMQKLSEHGIEISTETLEEFLATL